MPSRPTPPQPQRYCPWAQSIAWPGESSSTCPGWVGSSGCTVITISWPYSTVFFKNKQHTRSCFLNIYFFDEDNTALLHKPKILHQNSPIGACLRLYKAPMYTINTSRAMGSAGSNSPGHKDANTATWIWCRTFLLRTALETGSLLNHSINESG